jgi:hypothetical protein
MFEDVVHGNDVETAHEPADVCGLEGALYDVITTGATLGGDLWLDFYASALDVEELAEFVEMTAITRSDVEDTAAAAAEQPAVQPRPRASSCMNQHSRNTSVVFVVSVVVTRVEGGELGFLGSRVEELRSAVSASLYGVRAWRNDEVLQVNNVPAVERRVLGSADRARDHDVFGSPGSVGPIWSK